MSKQEREETVRRIWASSMTLASFVPSLGCTTQAITNIAHRLGLPPRRPGRFPKIESIT